MLGLRWSPWVLVVLGAGGCIITTAGDDDTGTATEATTTTGSGGTTNTVTTSGQPGSGGSTSDTDDSATSGTSGTVPDDCGENLLGDPGFEAGTPNPEWAESSDIFGTPICDLGCTEDDGATSHSGQWWVWFGGLEEPDVAAVAQAITIPAGDAYLSFFFEINAAQGELGDDLLVVEIDDEVVFMATDAEDYPSYAEIVVDVSPFADGGAHTLTFRAEVTGAGLTNFFVDDVSLVPCDAGGTGSTGSSSGTDSGSSGTDTSTGATDTDTATGTGMATDTTGEPTTSAG